MLEMLGTAQFWVDVFKIIVIDLLLSGDNAVVIALACRNLPPEQRKKGILFGVGGAVGRVRIDCPCAPLTGARSAPAPNRDQVFSAFRVYVP